MKRTDHALMEPPSRSWVNTFTELMLQDVQRARTALQHLLTSSIRLIPTMREGRHGLEFQGEICVGGHFSDPEDESCNYTKVHFPWANSQYKANASCQAESSVADMPRCMSQVLLAQLSCRMDPPGGPLSCSRFLVSRALVPPLISGPEISDGQKNSSRVLHLSEKTHMQDESIENKEKPANSVGPIDTVGPARSDSWIRNEFLRAIYLYLVSSIAAIKILAGGDEQAAQSILDALFRERLIKKVTTDLQRAGYLIKLTAAGANYCLSELGVSRGFKYNTTSLLRRHSLIRHDIASQLFVCGALLTGKVLTYEPEAASVSLPTLKVVDLTIWTTDGQKLGIEIERTCKYHDGLRAALVRAICAVRNRQFNRVIFVLKNARAVERYEEALDEDSLRVPPGVKCEWAEDGRLALTEDDIRMMEFVIGSPEIWEGAE